MIHSIVPEFIKAVDLKYDVRSGQLALVVVGLHTYIHRYIHTNVIKVA